MPFDPHPDLTTPPDDTVLWRYMDFVRFVQFLENRQLWFARLDQFADPLEGTLTDGEIRFKPAAAGEPPRFRDATADPIAQMMRHTSYVNCWRMGKDESIAMWELYGKSSGAVAITTTVGRLKQQLSKDPRSVYMVQMQYLDWAAPKILRGVFDPISRKDNGYKHEEEMRLFFWNTGAIQSEQPYSPELLPEGLAFAVDPQELTCQIWIGPKEKSSIQPLVESVVARYGLDIPIRASDKLTSRRSVQPIL